jgi:adenylyltransferase/sulfurtransferase
MATETLKLIVGVGEPLRGRLMLYDSLKMRFKEVTIRRDPKCELCGEHPSIDRLIDYEAFCNVQLPAPPAAADSGAVEISAQELKRVLDTGRPITLLDVREPHEWDIARIERARLTPLSKFDSYISELKPDDEIYLYCYKGKRSMTALKKLQERGFTRLKSLAGGIDRWSQEVDPRVPRY